MKDSYIINWQKNNKRSQTSEEVKRIFDEMRNTIFINSFNLITNEDLRLDPKTGYKHSP